MTDYVRVFACSRTAAVFVQNAVERDVLCKLTLGFAVILDSAELARLLLVGKAVCAALNVIVNIVLIIDFRQLQQRDFSAPRINCEEVMGRIS